jgi:XTP/dITP diphosphohydrolase
VPPAEQPPPVPGSRLLDVVKIVDTLSSEDGDPWRREQTHQSLARYLLEEAYEAYDAIAAHDLAALREELGDLLLQVVLHARMAQEADEPWSIDDVAGALAEKLVRRNPHVFAGLAVGSVEEITANWERIKREEKARSSVLDGVALSQPALALAAKILARARSAGIDVPASDAATAAILADTIAGAFADEEGLGELLFGLVARATAAGLDPEAALRRVALRTARAVREREAVQAGKRSDSDPIS